MHPLLENIFRTKTFTSSNNQIVKIHSETDEGQCKFLQNLIAENSFSHSIEIGFAYGMSTLAISEEISQNNGTHVVIDKFENSHWQGIGLDLINQAGLRDKVEFHEDFCYTVLPKLMFEGRKFDFAYIDSTKQFDWLLVDFFYIDKMLETGGIIVFDDVSFPGIRKLLRYLSQFPDYEIYSTYPANQPPSPKRNLLTKLRMIPKSSLFLKENILVSDFEMGLNTSCVALQKKATDSRNWDWHVEF